MKTTQEEYLTAIRLHLDDAVTKITQREVLGDTKGQLLDTAMRNINFARELINHAKKDLKEGQS